QCVEVAANLPGVIAVRDSKDPDTLSAIPAGAASGAGGRFSTTGVIVRTIVHDTRIYPDLRGFTASAMSAVSVNASRLG
ncbi:DUF397 domain-containing protein, partial [Streptosporangium subroseum]|uniref:DUF397 domain-containing protein n=1 Tax=Streptosporangium subroseum TaxID=106412 RepID=UPI0034497FA9